MNIIISSNNYMWRAKFFRLPNRNLLVLTFHHSIFDGKSIGKLLNHLEFTEPLAKCHTDEFFSAIEKNIQLNEHTSLTKSENENEKILNNWPIHNSCMIEEQKSKCILIDIDFIPVNNLKKFCRNNEITINQLINALVTKTVSIIGKEINELVIHTPVDLTQYSSKANYQNDIGCFIAIVHSILKQFKDKSILEIARCYEDEFKIKLAQLKIENDFDYKTLKKIIDDKFNRKTTAFSGGIAVSNIGEVNFNKENIKSIIKDIHFSTSLFGGLGIFVLSALTYDNRLKVSLSYTYPLLSEDFISSFINSFKAICIRLAEEIA